jgi:hypothetical protein
MGIEAHLEVGKNQYFPLEDDTFASKAIATFCTTALWIYCDFLSQHKVSDILKPNDRELVEWFATINSRMTADLCLLTQVLSGFWNYSEADYARYVNETMAYLGGLQHPEDSAIKLLSEEEFLDTCARDAPTWIDTARLLRTVDDLLRVFDEVHPPKMWWYNEENTLADFRALSKTLVLAAEKGYAKVRLNCE